MTATDISAHFPRKELTKLQENEDPTASEVQRIQREINEMASSVPSRLGGGRYGYMRHTVSNATWTALPNTQNWVDPVHPGPNVAHQRNATPEQMAENNRVYAADIKLFEENETVKSLLKQALIAAVPPHSIAELEHATFGYKNCTVLDILDHLTTTYGTVTPADLQANEARLSEPIDKSLPVTTLFTKAKEVQQYAAPHDRVSDHKVIREFVAVFKAAELFPTELYEWSKLPANQQTLAAFKTRINQADKLRRSEARDEPSQAPTYHSANQTATGMETRTAAPCKMIHYCWTHGLSSDKNHTSQTCNRKATGHQDSATLDNMMGGNPKIRPGQPTIYRDQRRNNRNNNNNNANNNNASTANNANSDQVSGSNE